MKIQVKDVIGTSRPKESAAAIIQQLVSQGAGGAESMWTNEIDLSKEEEVRTLYEKMRINAAPTHIRIIIPIKSHNITHRVIQIDLLHWTEVLAKVDDHLAEHVKSIQVCGETADISAEDERKSTRIVCSILRFLRTLLKGGKNKKHFQSFEVSQSIVSIVYCHRFLFPSRLLFLACRLYHSTLVDCFEHTIWKWLSWQCQ